MWTRECSRKADTRGGACLWALVLDKGMQERDRTHAAVRLV